MTLNPRRLALELDFPDGLRLRLPIKETQSGLQPYDGGEAGGYERSVGDLSQ
jgi:hypothetical protein